MDTILIHPCYGAPIVQYAAIAQAKAVVFEACDNYQKQTYRNRLKMATASRVLLLSIPILHNSKSKQRQQTRNVAIENKFHWQRDHWRSLKVAYQTSPFFEYYEDYFEPLYHQKFIKLWDFNMQLHAIIMDCLELEKQHSFTQEYEKTPKQLVDLRVLANAKTTLAHKLPAYHQLFHEKHGYISNLTILDLLFNLGPSAQEYLENVDLSQLL